MEKFSGIRNPEILAGFDGSRPATIDDDLKAQAIRRVWDLIDANSDGPGLIASDDYDRDAFDSFTQRYDEIQARTATKAEEAESSTDLLSANLKDVDDRSTRRQKIWELIDESDGGLVGESEELREEFDRQTFMVDTLTEAINSRASELDRRRKASLYGENFIPKPTNEIIDPNITESMYRSLGRIALLSIISEQPIGNPEPPREFINRLRLPPEVSENRNNIAGQDLGIIPPLPRENLEK